MRLSLALLFSCAACALFAADREIDCADPRYKTLEQVNSIALNPGDRLLLKSGCRWTGTLQPQGSGSEGRPIQIDRYGSGPLPAIDGSGAAAALLLVNQEFVEVRNLEITNRAETPARRLGVQVRAENLGRALRHVHLIGLDVHDVKGLLGADMVSKCTGGIGFDIVTRLKPTRLDDIVVEKNRIRAVDAMAIYINTDIGPHPRDPQWEQLRHTRVAIRGNEIEDTGKNAVCIRASLDPVIEANVIRGAAARLHGNAIYVFGCKGAVIQRNDVSGTRWHGNESAAFDSDYNSEGTIIQYNYSHSNGGGLVNFCANPASKAPRGYNDGTIVRFNVSRNEIERVFGFDGPATNSRIYNNTVYIGPGFKPRIVEFDRFGDTDGYAERTWFANNIIVNEGGGTYVYGKATNYRFENNCFSGQHPDNEPADPAKVTADPQFTSPGNVGDGIASTAGYRLKPSSPCAASGVRVPADGGADLFGAPNASATPDRGAIQSTPLPITKGVVFARPQGIELKADVYQPTGTGPFPAIIYFHGGGWAERQRQQLRRQAAYFASRGVLGLAVEYRLAKEAIAPASTHDAKEAVRWLRANAARYNVDPRRIAVAGSSAGGALALMLGFTQARAEFEGSGCCRDQSSSVAMVMALNPAIDLTAMPHRESLVTRLLGGRCEDKPDLCRAASPVTHAGSGAAPTLILHGTADETIPYSHAVALKDKLSAAGAAVELYTASGGAHTFWSTARWYDPSLAEMERWVEKYLLHPAPAAR